MKLIVTESQIAKAEKLIADTKNDIAKAIEKGKAHRYQEDIEKIEAIESMEEVDASRLNHSFYSSLVRQGKTTYQELFKTM